MSTQQEEETKMKKLTVPAELIKAYENRIKRLEEMAEAYEDYARCLENSLKTAKEFGAFKAAEVEQIYREREELAQRLERTEKTQGAWIKKYWNAEMARREWEDKYWSVVDNK